MAAALLLGALLLVSVTGRAAAARPPKNTLTNGWVSPGSGLTTTTFVFSVDYTSPGGFPASGVVAQVANLSVPLALVLGTNVNGTYRGSSLLPAGSWPVTFQATAAHGVPPLGGPTVVVLTPTPAPTPTPRATPRPTPVPTAPVATPSPTPTVGSPSTSPSATGGTVSSSPSETQRSGGGLPSGSSTLTPVAGGPGGSGTSLEDGLGTFLTGGLAAIGLLAAVGFTAIWRDRRRERAAAIAATAAPAAPPPAPAPRRRASTWERDYAVQDEPVGTVEFDELAPDADRS